MKRQRHVIGLGANLGTPLCTLQLAVALLAREPDVEVRAVSPVYRSAPVGPPQPDYLNGAVLLESPLSPAALLPRLHAIEAALGRVREVHWGPRTLDLDLLWSDDAVATRQLRVPHARLPERWWALQPLLDVAPFLACDYAQALCEQGGPRPSAIALPGPGVPVGGVCELAPSAGECGWTTRLQGGVLGPGDGVILCALALSASAHAGMPLAPSAGLEPLAGPDLLAWGQALVAEARERRLVGAQVRVTSNGADGLVLWATRHESARDSCASRAARLCVTTERVSLVVRHA